MKKAMLVAAIALTLSACSRSEKPISGSESARGQLSGSATNARFDSSPPTEGRLLYYPARERVLASGDNSSDDMNWQPLGLTFPAMLEQVHEGLTVVDTPLLDKDGNSKGALIPEASHFTLLAVGQWERWGSDFRRLYKVRIKTVGGFAQGWIDSSAAALILAEANGLSVGIVPRKILLGGGESEYSLLAIADGRDVTLVDTSTFPFPDAFHPSGVVEVTLEDVNADSQPEILLEAETIISLHYLGETPVRWKAWLQRRDGALVPIFQYNVSFGSDAGYSYTATDRAFNSNGGAMRDVVRVDTEYTLVSGEEEFRNRTVSFYPWNGSEFKRAALQDLPKLGTVTAQRASLLADADAQSRVLTTLSKGDQLYVFDRSDRCQSRDDPSSWWFEAVTKSGIEGWISGTVIELLWIDPLKFNRTAFISHN
jgi:hypothetical protein